VDGTNNHTNAANSNNHSATTNIDPASSTAALASSHAQQPAGNTNRPNKALKYIRPRRDCVPPPNPSITNWTESLLEQERNAFWATRTETQTEGDQEIWRGLQRTVGHLRDGDLKSAQTYFNASDLNCPTGNVLDEVYDAHGYKYEIPAWVVMTPASLHYADSPVEDMRPTTAGSNANDKPESGDAESAAFRVRCRFPLGKDVFITVREQELVSSMVRKIRLQRTVIFPFFWSYSVRHLPAELAGRPSSLGRGHKIKSVLRGSTILSTGNYSLWSDQILTNSRIYLNQHPSALSTWEGSTEKPTPWSRTQTGERVIPSPLMCLKTPGQLDGRRRRRF
jgi:hypothetical protein